ncbi:non-specific serine/threonine protein kinase [Entamoeba marina]
MDIDFGDTQPATQLFTQVATQVFDQEDLTTEKPWGCLQLQEHNVNSNISLKENKYDVGRDKKNDIVIKSQIASSFHLTIERIDNHVYIIDKSLNGTRNLNDGTLIKNEKSIVYLPVRLKIGDVEMTIDHEIPVFSDRYSLLKVLGNGATAQVKLYEENASGILVAVKSVDKKNRNINPNIMDSIQQEVNTLKELQHPHIVKVFELYDSPNLFNIVMEYVDGKSLEDLIVSYEDRNESTLDYPKNVNTEKCTTFCGTIEYFAPEVQSAGSEYNQASDIWCCGVLLYRMFFLKHFDFSKDFSQRELKLPYDVNNDIGLLLRSMLQINPKARPTASQVLYYSWMPPITNETNQELKSVYDFKPCEISSTQRSDFSIEAPPSPKSNTLQTSSETFIQPKINSKKANFILFGQPNDVTEQTKSPTMAISSESTNSSLKTEPPERSALKQGSYEHPKSVQSPLKLHQKKYQSETKPKGTNKSAEIRRITVGNVKLSQQKQKQKQRNSTPSSITLPSSSRQIVKKSCTKEDEAINHNGGTTPPIEMEEDETDTDHLSGISVSSHSSYLSMAKRPTLPIERCDEIQEDDIKVTRLSTLICNVSQINSTCGEPILFNLFPINSE